MNEPASVTAARAVIATYEERGECPNITNASVVSVWTCLECRGRMEPTMETHVMGGRRLHVLCHAKRKEGSHVP